MKIYLAGSIFYHGDVLRNTEWAAKIRAAVPNVDLYSPIENTDINGAEGKKKFAGSQEIANGDNIRLNNTTINTLLVFVQTIVKCTLPAVKQKMLVVLPRLESNNIVIKIFMSPV